MPAPGLSQYYSPHESHSNISSPIPTQTPTPTPTQTPVSSLIPGQKGRKLKDIFEERKVKTPTRPRSRPNSPRILHPEGPPKGRSDKSKADKHVHERDGEKTRTKKGTFDAKSKNTESKSSGSPEIRRAKSKEDVSRVKPKENLMRVRSREDLPHQDSEQQRPTSPSVVQLKAGKVGSPKILRKRNSQEIITDLKEATGVTRKESVDTATNRNHVTLNRLDSAPAHLNVIPPTPTQPDSASPLESSLDCDHPQFTLGGSVKLKSPPPEISMPEESAPLNAGSPVAEILKAMEDPE